MSSSEIKIHEIQEKCLAWMSNRRHQIIDGEMEYG